MPDWADLLQDVNEVDVPSDIREQAERRRAPSRSPLRRHRFLSRTASVIAVAVGCAVVLIILAVAAHSRRHSAGPSAPRLEIVRPDDVRVTARIIGGSSGLRQAIHDSLAGVGKSAITTVTVSPAGKRYGPAPQDGVVLTFASDAKGRAQKNYTSWQEGLVGTATRDRALLRGLEPIVFDYTENMGSRVLAERVPPRRADSPTASQLVASAKRSAKRLGVTLKSITVLKPFGLAAYVVIDAKHPGPFLASHSGAFGQAFPSSLSSSGQTGTGIDGWYVETRAGGATIEIESQDSRSNTTTSWIDKRYSGCSSTGGGPVFGRGGPVGVPLGGPRPAPPPPCPGVDKAIRVPSVVGETRSHAMALFRQLGLKVEPVFIGASRRHDRRLPVTGQWPNSGSIIGSNTTVMIYFERRSR
jgi:hypothetical protein